jgi:hypothetical protein
VDSAAALWLTTTAWAAAALGLKLKTLGLDGPLTALRAAISVLQHHASVTTLIIDFLDNHIEHSDL